MTRSPRVRPVLAAAAIVAALTAISACGKSEPPAHLPSGETSAAARQPGTVLQVKDTIFATTLDASGIAEPMQQATLSTKLMGSVVEVLVHEGDAVQAGQALVRLDAREMTAKASQVAASIADAEAMQKEAAAHAARFRALYADSAATRAQYDAAETGLARAEAGLRAARAAASELDAVSSYATVRAPFAGMITQRLADPGMFAAPGVPLLIIQDVSSLRVSATVDADALRGLARGQRVTVTIDTVSASATVEGIVPANAGNLFTVNAIVRNANHTLRAGSAVIMHLPRGVQQGILVPIGAIVHEGDLTGVVVRAGDRDERRWVRLGASHGGAVEVTSGLRAGESIVVPAAAGTTPAAATAPGA